MAKVKLTKNELKKQKDSLKRFRRYLPTLMLKKQQLQMEIRQVESRKEQLDNEKAQLKKSIDPWIEVFGEGYPLADFVVIEFLSIGDGNIAGVDIPLFNGIEFKNIEYDLLENPPWVDDAVDHLRGIIALDEEIKVLNEQVHALGEELRITSQRVNLFEKVKIPETRENIRKITIYLGDQQTAAVVRGKIAKSKLVRV